MKFSNLMVILLRWWFQLKCCLNQWRPIFLFANRIGTGTLSCTSTNMSDKHSSHKSNSCIACTHCTCTFYTAKMESNESSHLSRQTFTAKATAAVAAAAVAAAASVACICVGSIQMWILCNGWWFHGGFRHSLPVNISNFTNGKADMSNCGHYFQLVSNDKEALTEILMHFVSGCMHFQRLMAKNVHLFINDFFYTRNPRKRRWIRWNHSVENADFIQLLSFVYILLPIEYSVLYSNSDRYLCWNIFQILHHIDSILSKASETSHNGNHIL